MIKKIITILLIVILSLTFIGCGNEDKNNTEKVENNTQQELLDKQKKYEESTRFKSVDDKGYWVGINKYFVYYDSVTNIVYLASENKDRLGMNVLYDSDGKPMTLDRYNQTKDNSQN